ncbi:ABC transporter permease, partial [Streptococcus pyogenes]
DHHFLLPKEEAVVAHIKQAERSALVIWGCLQTAILIFLYPIFNRLGFSLVTFALLLLGLLALKRLLLGYKVRQFLKK